MKPIVLHLVGFVVALFLFAACHATVIALDGSKADATLAFVCNATPQIQYTNVCKGSTANNCDKVSLINLCDVTLNSQCGLGWGNCTDKNPATVVEDVYQANCVLSAGGCVPDNEGGIIPWTLKETDKVSGYSCSGTPGNTEPPTLPGYCPTCL